MAKHEFGGDWTTEKLERIRKYLCAYTTIFASNPRARLLTPIYLDAFAGTGHRADLRSEGGEKRFLDDSADPDAESLKKGSARIALEVEPPFKRYVFIERREERVRDLEDLRNMFRDKAACVEIVHDDANTFLQGWCAKTNWRQCRAVVFLDPYGMQVDWATVEALARTRAVDLWLLFPLGVAVNRLLTRSEPPPSEWGDALTRIFGTPTWRDEFYPRHETQTLFGPEVTQQKEADFDRIGRFFVARLKTIFAKVAENPLPLRNSTNTPLYLLCFAAGNSKGAATAVKIAQDILKG
ncbi:MAG TPA: three-Cys-motif partner protein TcmP [Phycisphaerae bacterium]|nr:three-Cys-motif partner protein TcmP [Phycisphaerae bacterium]